MLEPSLTILKLYSLIGFENIEYTYDNYKDVVSIAKDPAGNNNGYTICGDREHELTEDGTTPKTYNYIELEEINKISRKIKYGTSDASLVGNHDFKLKVYLVDSPAIQDSSAEIKLTFNEQRTILEITDQVYLNGQGLY